MLDCKGEGSAVGREELEKIQVRLGTLHEILLSFGGSAVAEHKGYYEEDLDKLLSRGQLWLAHGIEKMKGRESQCHMHSAYLWNANKDKEVYLATGYALSESGVWYQHSWCLHRKKRSVSVVETTSPKRMACFGYVMAHEVATNFYFDNE